MSDRASERLPFDVNEAIKRLTADTWDVYGIKPSNEDEWFKLADKITADGAKVAKALLTTPAASGEGDDAPLSSWKFMAVQLHRKMDEMGVPKPPENEPGIAWRMLWLTTALREAQQRAERLEAALTPSGDTKGEYSGEFKFDVRRTDWDGNEYCESVTVPWTTVKEIMAAIRKRAALQPAAAAEAIIAAYDGADTIYLHRPECSALRGKSNTFAWDDSAIVQAKENRRSVVPCKCTKVHRAAATAFAAGEVRPAAFAPAAGQTQGEA